MLMMPQLKRVWDSLQSVDLSHDDPCICSPVTKRYSSLNHDGTVNLILGYLGQTKMLTRLNLPPEAWDFYVRVFDNPEFLTQLPVGTTGRANLNPKLLQHTGITSRTQLLQCLRYLWHVTDGHRARVYRQACIMALTAEFQRLAPDVSADWSQTHAQLAPYQGQAILVSGQIQDVVPASQGHQAHVRLQNALLTVPERKLYYAHFDVALPTLPDWTPERQRPVKLSAVVKCHPAMATEPASYDLTQVGLIAVS